MCLEYLTGKHYEHQEHGTINRTLNYLCAKGLNVIFNLMSIVFNPPTIFRDLT